MPLSFLPTLSPSSRWLSWFHRTFFASFCCNSCSYQFALAVGSKTVAATFAIAYSSSFALAFSLAFLRLQSFWPNAQKNGYINHFQSTATATIAAAADCVKEPHGLGGTCPPPLSPSLETCHKLLTRRAFSRPTYGKAILQVLPRANLDIDWPRPIPSFYMATPTQPAFLWL